MTELKTVREDDMDSQSQPVSVPSATTSGSELSAVCIIPNCRRGAPPAEPFCAKHRGNP